VYSIEKTNKPLTIKLSSGVNLELNRILLIPSDKHVPANICHKLSYIPATKNTDIASNAAKRLFITGMEYKKIINFPRVMGNARYGRISDTHDSDRAGGSHTRNNLYIRDSIFSKCLVLCPAVKV